MANGTGQQRDWYRLDNAGVLYTALQKERYSAIYRFSALMTERVDPAALQRAVDKARLLRPAALLNRVTLSTFGRFDLFINGRAVEFRHAKARELLALMTARLGGDTAMDVIIDRLWEGAEYTAPVKAKYRKAVMHLRETLAQAGLGHMLLTSRGHLRMDFSGVKCDYFDLLRGSPAAAAHYTGVFMMDYSWSEFYLPTLDHLANSLLKNG